MGFSPHTWLLLDERAGNRAQVLGVVQKLGAQAEAKEIRYNALAALPNLLLGAHLWHLTSESKANIQGPWPALVIAAGRRTAPVARYIKAQSPETKLVQLMWPDAGADDFSLIALPEHDDEKHNAPNILRTLGSPHGVTPAILSSEAEKWQKKFAKLPRPWFALLIGGTSRHAEYEAADFKTLAAYASAEAERLNGSLLITSSPRTGKEGEELTKQMLVVPHYFHTFGATGDNPYLAFLGLADAIIVSGDSVSMCSEACGTGKPVYIFMPPHMREDKFRRFRESLFAKGFAKSHTYPIRLDWKPETSLDAAGEVARAIKKLF